MSLFITHSPVKKIAKDIEVGHLIVSKKQYKQFEKNLPKGMMTISIAK